MLSSEEDHTDRVQQNNLIKNHNATNPSDPIANQDGDSGDIGGGGRPKNPPPKPLSGQQSNPSKGGHTDRVKQNNLQKDHNAANLSDPIANQGGDSGDIGGVGIKGGLIEGLFDGIEASLQTQHHFFFPGLGKEHPFFNEEHQQLLPET